MLDVSFMELGSISSIIKDLGFCASHFAEVNNIQLLGEASFLYTISSAHKT